MALLAASLLPGCTPSLDLHATLSPAHALAASQHRLEIQLLDPKGLDTARVRARVVYRPLQPGAPGTMVTTTRRDNCQRGRYDLLPPLTPCTQSHERRIGRDVEVRNLQRDGDRLLLDFDPVLLKDGNAYRVEDLYLSLDRCDGRDPCSAERLELWLTCYAQDGGESQLGRDFIASYRQGAAAPEAARDCGLMDGEWEGWANGETVLKRVIGNVPSDEPVSLGSLLPSYAAIPTRDGGWRRNPSFGMENMHAICPAPRGYDRVDTASLLDGLEGWPHSGTIETIVYWKTGGGLCSIWLDIDEPGRGRIRYFFDYREERIVQLRIDESMGHQRAFRFDASVQPMEWLEQDGGTLGSHSSGDGFRYWNAAAAEEWPERFEGVAPDAERFAQAERWAAALAEHAALERPAPSP